jgi:hypothetical protein
MSTCAIVCMQAGQLQGLPGPGARARVRAPVGPQVQPRHGGALRGRRLPRPAHGRAGPGRRQGVEAGGAGVVAGRARLQLRQRRRGRPGHRRRLLHRDEHEVPEAGVPAHRRVRRHDGAAAAVRPEGRRWGGGAGRRPGVPQRPRDEQRRHAPAAGGDHHGEDPPVLAPPDGSQGAGAAGGGGAAAVVPGQHQDEPPGRLLGGAPRQEGQARPVLHLLPLAPAPGAGAAAAPRPARLVAAQPPRAAGHRAAAERGGREGGGDGQRPRGSSEGVQVRQRSGGEERQHLDWLCHVAVSRSLQVAVEAFNNMDSVARENINHIYLCIKFLVSMDMSIWPEVVN